MFNAKHRRDKDESVPTMNPLMLDLQYELHERLGHDGQWLFCAVCADVMGSLMPLIRDYIWNGSDNHDLD